MTVELLKKQIRDLMKMLTRNGFELRTERRINRMLELHAARVEIYKSIAHRQGLIIEMMTAEAKFNHKEAA